MRFSSSPEATRAATLPGVALVLGLLFWTIAALPYFTTHRENFGAVPEQFWDRRYVLWAHILGGTIALLVGPVQFFLGETGRHWGLHRKLGNLWLAGIALTCVASFYLALTANANFGYSSGLFGLAVASSITATLALVAVKNKQWNQHREWMVRSYITVFGFVIFRAVLLSLSLQGLGGPGPAGNDTRLTVAAWSCWSLPLLFTEATLQWKKLRYPPR